MRRRSRTGLAGALSLLIALVLIPIGLYIFTVLEPQRHHMLERNLRVLAETGRELEAELGRLSYLITFTLVPVDQKTDPDSVAARVAAAEAAREEAEAALGEASGSAPPPPDAGPGDGTAVESLARQAARLERRKAFLERQRSGVVSPLRYERASREEVARARRTAKLGACAGSPQGSAEDGAAAALARDCRIAKSLHVQDGVRRLVARDAELDREIAQIERRLQVLALRGAELERASSPTKADRDALARGLDEARREEARARRLSDYLEGLRKTPEYRAIEIVASDEACKPDAPMTLSLAGEAPTARVEAVGCRRPLTEDGEDHPVRITIDVPFDDLAAPLAAAAAAAFDQLIVANAAGDVLYASRGGPLRPADDLGSLLRSARATGTVERLEGLVGTGGGALEAGNETGAETLLRAARQHPVEVEIGETWYRVFAHPLRSPVTEEAGAAGEAGGDAGAGAEEGDAAAESPRVRAGDEPWFVVGVVSDARFSAGSLASSRSQLALAISGLVLLLLAWPWLRLLFSGPRERISIREILELVISLALAVGLLTLVVADLASRAALQRRLDETASALAARIENGFRAELRDTLDSLEDARRRICLADLVGGPEAAGRAHISWPRNGGELVYPPYDVAFVLDSRGVQMGEQANYRAGEVSRIRVSTRDYFKRIRDGRPWRLSGDPERRFFLQRIKTYDHGWRLSAVSAPIPRPDAMLGTVCDGAVAVALTRRFASLSSVVLPPGFGFAIVDDETGEVRFHSSDGRSLVENFLAETGPDPRVANLIGLRRDRTLEGRYRTEGAHRFRVHPLRDLPWTLVIFQRTGLYDVLRFEMLLAAGSFLALYVLGLVTVSLLAAWATPGSRWSWLWPTGSRRARYRRAVLFVAWVGLFDVLAVLWLRGADLLVPILTLPPMVLGTVYLSLYAGSREAPRGRGGAWACIAIGACGVLAVVAKVAGGGGVEGLRALALVGVALLGGYAGGRISRAPEDPHDPDPGSRVAYFALLLALLAVVVVLPALAVFKDVQRAALDRITRQGQRVAVAAEIARREGLRADAERIDPERFRERPDTVVQRAPGAACRGLYLWPGVLAPAGAAADAGGACDLITESPRSCRKGDEAYHAAFSVGLTRQLPGISRTALELRQLFDAGAGDESECWPSDPGPATGSASHGFFDDAASDPITYLRHYGTGSLRMVSPRIPIPLPAEGDEWAIVAVGTAATGALAVLLVWLLGNRVLGLRIPEAMGAERWTADEEGLARDRLVLFPPPHWARRLARRAQGAGWAVDAVDAAALADWSPHASGDRRLLIVDELHACLPDDGARGRVLARLESILRDGGHRLVLCSDVHPLDYLRTSTFVLGHATAASEDAPGADAARRALDRERLRWGVLLAGLRPTRIAWTPPPMPAGAHPALTAVLRRECDWTPWLTPVRDEIAADLRFRCGDVDERELVHWVAERGEPLFRRIWALLPAEDRLALIQLAEGNLLNPRNSAMIERLLRRGLICRDGTFKLVSRSFGLFASRVELPERLREWERGVAGGPWDLVRIPLAAIFLLILAYAVYAGRDTVDATLAAIPAIVAGFPTVVRILGSLRVAGGASAGDVGAGMS